MNIIKFPIKYLPENASILYSDIQDALGKFFKTYSKDEYNIALQVASRVLAELITSAYNKGFPISPEKIKEHIDKHIKDSYCKQKVDNV